MTCSSVIASCRRATFRLWSPSGAGYRLAWSWTLIRAPVSEFLSWWASPAANWARSRVRSDCRIVCCISLSWTHMRLIDRDRSCDLVALAAEVELLEVALRDQGHLPLHAADPPADAVGDPARDERPSARASRRRASRAASRPPTGPAASWSRGRAPGATSRAGRSAERSGTAK